MSREIVFRAKRIDNGEWVEGRLLIDYVSGQYFIHSYGNSVNESDKVNEEGCLKFFANEVDAETVCRYIGVKDKNGKEIYEGDIILSDDGKIGQVQWFEEHLAFMIWCVIDNKVYFAYDNDFSKIEVIGSVYENADLLKEAGNE